MEEEIWRDIPSYEGRYQISTFGRVKSLCRSAERILKCEISRNGYCRVSLKKKSKDKHFCVHRLVAEVFIPNDNEKFQVNHRDGNKLNNHVSNLEWVTPSGNIRHAIEKGLRPSGELCQNARLTAEQVIFIRNECNHLTQKQVATMFNVNPATINEIRLGKSYRNTGGAIRLPHPRRISDKIRSQIKSEYKRGVRGQGCASLAKKFGLGYSTVWYIIHEK